jgi:hypothetical protein
MTDQTPTGPTRFRMLVAAPADQATGPGDFTFTDDGELLYEGQVVCCSSVTCGCSRSMAGVDSSKATTVAVVVEVEMPRAGLIDIADRVAEKAGWDNNDVLYGLLRIQAVASSHPVGTLLRAWFNPEVDIDGMWEYTRFGEEVAR